MVFGIIFLPLKPGILMHNDTIIKSFNLLKKNLKKDSSHLKVVKIAIVGDTSTQFLNQAIKGMGVDDGYNFDVYEADYDQVDAQILDVSSELYQFKPEFVIIFLSNQKIQKRFIKSDKNQFADKLITEVENYYTTLTAKLKSKIIFFNFPNSNDGVFGNYAAKVESSFPFQVQKLNYHLNCLAVRLPNFFVFDYCSLNTMFGRSFCFDSKVYVSTDMALSIDVLPYVAKNIADIILSILGKFKKCLIIDLDNTMWGGIIGDDGIENILIGDLGIGKAYTELQRWFKQLQERGIIIAICSKNEEAAAKDPFLNHPDMILKMEDIAVFVANWENKADNIKYIQSILNIGFDSMVFLDDNPVEREMVKTHVPEVTIPDLPEDPSQYLEYLLKLNLFETASYSQEDKLRTKQYQEEAGRAVEQKSFTNEDDFLTSLKMTSEVKPFDKFNVPRIAQLSQRSNQFNLRTLRYTEEDVIRLSESDDHFTLSFNLVDKFGNNGLICIIVLQKQENDLFIESWLMSCRVLKRSMENFTLNTIVKIAREHNFKTIIGEYLPTSKNIMVKDHYRNLGFEKKGELWELAVDKYNDRKCFINL